MHFVKIVGIHDGAEHLDHRGEIELLDWSWSEFQNLGNAGGPAAGRVSMEDVIFSMLPGPASPRLMQACASGSVLREVTLTSYQREVGAAKVQVILKEVLVSSFTVGCSPQGGRAIETVKLSFRSLEYLYQRPGAAPIRYGWDRSTQRGL